MLPLSTPTSSGLAVDLLAIAIVLAPIGAFVVGLADLWTRLRHRAPAVDAVTLAAYGGAALVGLAVLVMRAGGRGIPLAQAVFLAIAVWGLVCAVTRAGSWWRSAQDAGLARTGLLAAAACWSIWFWANVFQDHVGLPVAHDGIAHTAWYLRILEAGVPTLGRVPIGFRNLFGTQMFDFYPTGTHALVAIASGFWGQWGVVSHAGILKAWFTLVVAAAPWALFFVIGRLMPRMPWWIGLALVFLATPGFRFPLEAAHEGGASRIFAHVLLAPVYADAVLGRFEKWSSLPLAAAVLGLSFLMHPTAFVTLAALLAYATLFAAATAGGRRARLARLAGACIAIAGGGLLTVDLLRWNAGAILPRDPVDPFSLAALRARLADGWNMLFEADYGMDWKAWLVVIGLALLMVRRKALGVPWRVAALPLCLTLVAVCGLAARMVSLPGFALVGGAYYDQSRRITEVLYEGVGLCFVALAWSVWSIVRGREAESAASAGGNTSGRAKVASAIAVALVVAAAGYGQASAAWVRDHIGFWDRKFMTPRISRLEALGTWIEKNTPPDAIVFHPPFDSEVWEAWTGRRGIFMYGECHVHNGQRPCIARKDLVNDRIDILRRGLNEPAAAQRCLTQIDRFERPSYFVVPTPFASTGSFAVCSDALYVMTIDGHAVFTYHKPDITARTSR